ncbi:unnamed protein product [Strongylus vulgaris]|uniref:LTD domain-containing protein n=1 Tax=Strongylus vulgaris TaxID=40348 RepID=A0A3P7L4M2_STRVU|nr:unnamed protein product [Strongylus vulgaris]
MRLEQWTSVGRPGLTKDVISSIITSTHEEAKTGYDADAEKIPSLNAELNDARSRYETAMRERDTAAEDALLVRLCEIRSQICLAKGRGRAIQEECDRLRKENQKLIDDISAQRQIFDRETQERYTYESRAKPLLQECEELLRKCKMVPVPKYSFDDIERDRKQWRAEVEASMVDIRRQYDILASTLTSEMEQWYKEKVMEIGVKQREETSSFKKRLADLRAELADVRSRLNHLEERNRLLTSLIADFEDARAQEQKIADACVKEDEDHLKKLIDRYEELLAAGPSEERYSVVTLRAEIRRYRELLDSVGEGGGSLLGGGGRGGSGGGGNGGGFGASGSGGGFGAGGSGEVIGGKASRQLEGGPTTYFRSTTTTKTSQIGSGASDFGGGVTSTYVPGGGITLSSEGGAVTSGHSQIGSGASVAVPLPAPQGTIHYSWSERNPTTVTTTVDYTMRDERSSVARSGPDHHEYNMQRSAKGNVTIGKVANDGSYVTIENTSMDIDQDIGGWTLRSTSSTLKQVSYTFPPEFSITPQSAVKVFARGKGPHNPPHSVVCEMDTTFATGDDLDIYLYDKNNAVSKQPAHSCANLAPNEILDSRNVLVSLNATSSTGADRNILSIEVNNDGDSITAFIQTLPICISVLSLTMCEDCV